MNKAFDRYTSIFFILTGLFFILESQALSDNSYGSVVGSSVFPVGLGVVMVLLSILNFFQTYRTRQTNKPKESLQYKKFLIMLAALIAYVLLLEPLGYIISTFLFLLVGFQTMGRGKVWASVGISAAISGGVYAVYVDLMSGTLPGLPEWISF